MALGCLWAKAAPYAAVPARAQPDREESERGEPESSAWSMLDQAQSPRLREQKKTATMMPAATSKVLPELRSDLQNHRHDQRPPAGALLDIPLQIVADLLLDDAVVHLLLGARGLERPLDHLPRLGEQA